jgi:DNA-binding NarL/FixJ family response regulator
MAIPDTVIVADDEAHVRMYVRLILKQMGVSNIIEASNAKEAIELYRHHMPDLALFDINMPGMTGIEALPKILEIDEDAVVVMLTGQASRQLVEESEKAGAAYYIRKDMPRETVMELLQNLFDEIFEEDEE